MTRTNPNIKTTDPRIREGFTRDETPISPHQFQFVEEQHPSDVSELSERIETLANETGNLRTVILDRPIKYNTQIRGLDDPNYELKDSILVLVEEYPADDLVIASIPEYEIFGDGSNLSDALIALKQSLLDLYEELINTDQNELGELPRAWMNTLHDLICKRVST